MNVLITGAFGYLGGRISRHLADQDGLFLRLCTRRRDFPAPDWLRSGELVPAEFPGTDPAALCEGVNAVVHLAALNENDCAADPARAFQVNTAGTWALLQAARKAGAERFIFFSTARVYREPLEGRVEESQVPRPIHPYGTTHRAAEDPVLAAHDRMELCGVVLRLSNGFGAPLDAAVNRWTLLVNDLCRTVVREKKIVLKSHGLQPRNFITLEDVARAVEYFLGLPRPACGDGLFNLGGEASTSVLAMAQLVAQRCKEVLGFEPPIERPVPKPDEAVPTLDYRIDKLKSTGFALQGSWEREVDDTLRLCARAFGGPA